MNWDENELLRRYDSVIILIILNSGECKNKDIKGLFSFVSVVMRWKRE